MSRYFWRLSRWAFFAVVALLVVALAVFIFVPQTSVETGCYWEVQGAIFVACKNFPLAPLVAFVANLPLVIFVYSLAFWQGHPVTMVLGLFSLCLLILAFLYPLRWLYVRYGPGQDD